MTHPVVREHDEAVLQAVETIGRPVAISDAPNGALDALLAGSGPGYYIIYPIGGGSRDGSVADPYADIELTYQITCVDQGPEGVRWLSDQLEPKLAALSVPNRRVLWVRPTAPSGIWPDNDTAAQTLYFTTPTFRIRTAP